MLVVLFAVALMIGNTFYPLDEVIRVIVGETVPGASFTVCLLYTSPSPRDS